MKHCTSTFEFIYDSREEWKSHSEFMGNLGYLEILDWETENGFGCEYKKYYHNTDKKVVMPEVVGYINPKYYGSYLIE